MLTSSTAKAVKRTFWRILFFYVLGSLAIGVMVPYNDNRLDGGTGNAASSPWVIGMKPITLNSLSGLTSMQVFR